MSETSIVRSCMDYLSLRKLLFFRMNTGGFKGQAGGFYRFGTPGMADLVTWLPNGQTAWLEVKTPKGQQSELQRQFQAKVEGYDHVYYIIRDVEQLMRKI